MTEATPALVAEGITSGYDEVPIVQDVSIHVGQDEIVTIIGPNGAGKSTVLKALFGFLPVWQGRV
ncbi:MAG: livF-6, partial [Thermomicrobiales bacterium]|nr:livF-6 [Thermomicrobiales bacterium]